MSKLSTFVKQYIEEKILPHQQIFNHFGLIFFEKLFEVYLFFLLFLRFEIEA